MKATVKKGPTTRMKSVREMARDVGRAAGSLAKKVTGKKSTKKKKTSGRKATKSARK